MQDSSPGIYMVWLPFFSLSNSDWSTAEEVGWSRAASVRWTNNQPGLLILPTLCGKKKKITVK